MKRRRISHSYSTIRVSKVAPQSRSSQPINSTKGTAIHSALNPSKQRSAENVDNKYPALPRASFDDVATRSSMHRDDNKFLHPVSHSL